eukprot:TRINITY_DN2992_c0_g1_i1.p1 TRINITY_DN2992_c0_g1~~TRINITY_DN2992_c0_g1_i1.p1  ORF type:complete len:146 (+),score=38.47 TRINITY_DN2992_c0_g1_i1:266-703(+)
MTDMVDDKPTPQAQLAQQEPPSSSSSKDLDEKALRKLHKKQVKAERAAARRGDDSAIEAAQKTCDLCQGSKNVLIRCQIDDTQQWKMVCPKCWKDVSGGKIDGDEKHEFYRYGGIWKNHKAGVSGKKPKHKSSSTTNSTIEDSAQ